jgi:uncharacterized protein (TIGR03089 family)
VTTPYDLLRGEVRRDGSRPLLTYYDDETGERIELSVTTFDNWVAKTVGLLRDGLGADAGARVSLRLPPHWQSLVWAMACWAVGACVTTGQDGRADVVVTGPDGLDAATSDGATNVVALSLRPLGARFTEVLPPGVLDYAVEVPSYPDQMAYLPPDEVEPGLDGDGGVHTLGGLVAYAEDRRAQLGLEARSRVLVATEDLGVALRGGLLVPLVVGGSSVLIRNENRPARERRVAAERVTAVVNPV